MPARPRARGRAPSKIDRTRARLVAAAREEVEAAGGFTAEAVARRAGTSPATFYNHFASKEDALVAVFADAMDALVDFVDEHLRIERVLELGLEGFASEWLLASAGFFRRNSPVFRAAQMRAPASKAIRGVYRSREAAALEHYERFVRHGQAAHAVRAGDAASIAHALMITSEGWNHPSVLAMKRGDSLHAELTRALVGMLAPGEGENGARE